MELLMSFLGFIVDEVQLAEVLNVTMQNNAVIDSYIKPHI